MREKSEDLSDLPTMGESGSWRRDTSSLGSEHGEWATELVRWYEAEWMMARSSGRRPNPDRVMEVLDPSRRPIVRELFDFVDSRYRTTQPEKADSDLRRREPGSTRKDDSQSSATSSGSNVDSRDDAMLEPTLAIGDASTEREDQYHNISADTATLDYSEGTVRRRTKITSRGSDSLDAGTRLPHLPNYVIHQVLGRGGMGVVYLATQQNIDRFVALKMVLAGGHASQKLLDRFQAEARAVGQLQHENIVRIFESGFHEGLPYFSLEFIDGPSLSERIGGTPMDPIEAARLLVPVAKGLDYAHRKGIIHRDIKPANILLTTDGVPKISDFGLAKQLESDEELSRTGDILGTPSYMAPEQAQGARDIDAAADIYALGAVLYCALTGRPPFQSSRPTDTLVQVIHQEPVMPTRLQPSIDRDLETICLKCLQKNPSERYASADDLACDLEHYLRGEPIQARPIGRLERAWRWSKRNRRMAGLITTAASLAMVLAIGGPVVAGIIYGQKQEVETAKEEAEQNAKQAEDNARQAQIAQATAEENEKMAELNAEAAATQEKNAIDALKSVVFEVQRKMKGQPSIQPLRIAILEIARDGLKRMQEAGNDYQAQDIISAGLYRRMGDLKLELGMVETANENYQTCLDALIRVRERGQLPNPRHNISTAYENLGEACRRAGKLEESQGYFEKCIEERRQWVKEEPHNQGVVQNLASTLGKAGTLAIWRGNMEAARRLIQESADLRKEFLDKNPGSESARMEWIGARWAVSLLTFQEGKIEAAISEISNVIEETEAIIGSLTQPFPMRHNVCRFRKILGDMFLYSGNLESAAAAYETAVADCRNLAEQDKKDSTIQATLGDLLYRLGVVAVVQGDQDGAVMHWQECLGIRKPLYEGEPDNLAKQVGVMVVLARLRDLDELAPILESSEKLVKSEAGMLYELAGVYSLVAEALDQGATPPGTIWTVAAAEGLSLQALKKATDLGFRRTADLEKDPDFSQVRKTEGYQRLMASIKK